MRGTAFSRARVYSLVVFKGLGIYTTTAQVNPANLKEIGVNATIKVVEWPGVMARRPHTVELLRKLYLNAYRHFPPSIRFAGGHAHMHAEHRTLLDLCRQRDVAKAKAHLEDHILIGSRNLIARLRAERAEADRVITASV
jgi:hypothetical protein